MILKVCGMREPHNIRAVEQLDIDLMGFIFYPKSKRYVGSRPDYLPQGCQRVGVFVNAEKGEIVARAQEFGLSYVQLHGNETLNFASELRQTLAEHGMGTTKIIRAISVTSQADAQQAALWEGCADLLLFETPTSGYGGSGQSFDWQLLAHYSGSMPFLLAGGIGPESLGALQAFRHPQWIGIDLNSKFETSPALKDVESLKTFTQEFHNLTKDFHNLTKDE